MNTFKNISQLKEEKKRLRNRCVELEKNIDNNWFELKHSLRPANLLSQFISKTIERKKENNIAAQVITENLVSIASKLTSAVSQKVEQKIEKWMNK
jgi:hypothetical protein